MLTDRTNITITLDELLISLKENNKSCCSLILKSNQLLKERNEEKISFFEAIKTNDTLTYLDICSNRVDDLFVSNLINSLINNFTIITLYYDKTGISETLISELQKILLRNRQLALEKIINPVEVTVKPTDYKDYLSYVNFNDGDSVLTFSEYYEIDYFQQALQAAKRGDVDLGLSHRFGSSLKFTQPLPSPSWPLLV